MLASFFRNAVFLLVLNLLVKGIYLFVIERTVQNILPGGDYGLYFSLLGLGLILQVVADFGLQHYSMRTISGHRHLLAKYFPHFLGLKLLLGGAFCVLTLGAGVALGYRGWQLGLLGLVSVAQFFSSLAIYLRSNLAGLGRYAYDSLFSVLDKLLMIGIVGGVLWLAPARLSITFFAGTQVLCWFLTAAGVWYSLRNRLTETRPRFRRSTLVLLLRGGAPFALAVLLQAAYTRTDAVMIERLLPDGALAADHYAAGYRLLDALNTVGWLTAGLLLPMFARLHARGEPVRDLLRFSLHLLLGGGIVAGVLLAAYARPIVYLLYDFAEPRTAAILFFLMLTFVAQCLNYVYGALLGGTGLIGRMNWVFVAGLLLNFSANWWVLPRYGAPGAAAVTLVTQALVASAQVVLAHRWLPLAHSGIEWDKMIALAGLVATVVILTASMVDWWWGWQITLAAAISALLMVALRLVVARQLTDFLRTR